MVRRRFALALSAGALLSLAMRDSGTGYLAVAAFVPLLAALDGERSPLRAGLLLALAWTGLAIPAIEGTVLVLWWAFPLILAGHGIVWLLAGVAHALVARGRYSTPMLLPLIVTAMEYVSARRSVFGDAALELLAYTQADTLLLRVAPWSGTSGVTLAAAALGCGGYWLLVKRPRPAVWTVVVLTAVLLTPVPGVDDAPTPGSVRVGVVQSAEEAVVSMLAKYDDGLMTQRMARFESLTRAGVDRGAELVVWGETVLPGEGMTERLPASAVRALLAAPVVLAGSRERAADGLFNSTFAWRGSDLELVARKQALVPVIEAHYSRGAPVEPVSLQGARVAAFVCLDSLHGSLSRESVRRGAEMIVYVTDDTFASGTATPWFHLATAALRAAETGRSVVFANEHGPSALITPRGDRVASSEPGEPAVLVADLEMRTGTTPYAALGDLVGPVACVLVGVAGASRGRPRFPHRGVPDSVDERHVRR